MLLEEKKVIREPKRKKIDKANRKAAVRAAERHRNVSFEAPKKKKKNRHIFFISILIIIIAGMAVISFYAITYFSSLESQEQGRPDLGEDITAAGFDFITDKENRKILHLKPTFRVNLAGLEGRRIMVVTIWLEVDTLDVAREFNDDHAKYRRVSDDIIRTLKSWKYAELIYGNGMDRLKNQLKERINQYIRRGKVKKVYFRDVQFRYLLPAARPDYS